MPVSCCAPRLTGPSLVPLQAMKAAGRISRRAMERDFASADFQQEELLKGLITANKDTEFGRDHGFAALLAAPDPVSIPLQAKGGRCWILRDASETSARQLRERGSREMVKGLGRGPGGLGGRGKGEGRHGTRSLYLCISQPFDQ